LIESSDLERPLAVHRQFPVRQEVVAVYLDPGDYQLVLASRDPAGQDLPVNNGVHRHLPLILRMDVRRVVLI
jgi:hypothetical protein